jgi:Glutaredoxin and related proteins
MIKFYHREGCGQCKYAQTKLNQKNILYEDILVDTNNENDSNFIYLKELGVKNFPVLITEDDKIISGIAVTNWIKELL